jgi:ferric-dicitrate binding protein FerR (iron transport regulator)
MELIRRYIDGMATAEDHRALQEALRHDAALRRQFARYTNLDAALGSGRLAAAPATPVEPIAGRRTWTGWFSWRPLTAAAAAFALAFIVTQVVQARLTERREIASVTAASGAAQFFGAHGALRDALSSGVKLAAGDSIETRSGDATAALVLRDGGKITLGGSGSLRILEGDGPGGAPRWNLTRGALWVSADAQSVVVQTQNTVVQASGSQFDIQATAERTVLRVNSGLARVRSLVDGRELEVAAGRQTAVGMHRDEPPVVVAQPQPVEQWTCSFSPAVQPAYGNWLPARDSSGVRLCTAPLLWPRPKLDPLLLHVASFRVFRDSKFPVRASADSTLVFRGFTTRPHLVRFGFSTQKVRGVFAGKFEVDVPAKDLGPVGREWEVRLPLAKFHPLPPRLADSPEGLELVDVYALTRVEDAGLELSHIELTQKK